jgi:hypothetical protein
MDDASVIEDSQSEPEQPFLGTVRLEGLHYQNVDIPKLYSYGAPRPSPQRSRPC